MKSRSIQGMTLYYDPPESQAAALIGEACRRSAFLIGELWGLETPADCRVYVMTSWLGAAFHSAPWPWKIYLALTLPLRYSRIQRLWQAAGGWSQRYGKRSTVGVKPPSLLRAAAQSGSSSRIFIEREPDEWAEHNTCHELVHAFSNHLDLPGWLQEGLAMVTVDRYAGIATVREDTLAALKTQQQAAGKADAEALLRLYLRGYWLTRFLVETRPGLLRSLLQKPQTHGSLEGKLAVELGIDPGRFWEEIDAVVLEYFEKVPADD